MKKIFVSGVIISLALILFGWITVPKEHVVGVLAALGIMTAYGAAGWLRKIPSESVRFGLIAAAVFTAEIILEYVKLPNNNTILGYVEFGSVFLIYIAAAVTVVYKTKSVKSGIRSAFWTAMISSLVWVIVALSVFYIFRGTPRQKQVFLAEGNYIDYALTGKGIEFNVWIMEDFMGAVFYHSLLMPVISLILGTAGGLLTKGFMRIRLKNS